MTETTPSTAPAPGASEQTAPPKEPTIPEKLEATLNTEATKFHKLRGITMAAFRIQEARDLLVGETVNFEPTHSDVERLDTVLRNLAQYG